MFRLADIGVVYWPVTLRSADENGNPTETTLHVAYRVLTRAELRAREREVAERVARRHAETDVREAPDDAAAIERMLALFESVVEREAGDVQFLRDRITDWRGVVDQDGQPVPFSPERLDALLGYDFLFKPLLLGLHEASRAGPLKNLSPGPAGAPTPAQA